MSDHDPPGADFTSSSLTKYVKRAPPHEMRFFIWTLEEHKDVNISLDLLDEYFVSMIGTYLHLFFFFFLPNHHHVTFNYRYVVCWFSLPSDGHCSVLKKSGNQNVSNTGAVPFCVTCRNKTVLPCQVTRFPLFQSFPASIKSRGRRKKKEPQVSCFVLCVVAKIFLSASGS